MQRSLGVSVQALLLLVIVAWIPSSLARARTADVDQQTRITMLTALKAFERQDYTTALRLFRGPADRGYAVAQRYLGIMYLDGLGVLAKPQEGIAWLERAHAQGDLDAAQELGVAYLEGVRLPKDERRAFELFKGAAEQGHDAAAASLARMYRDGIGTVQDRQAAGRWYTAAAQLGHPGAMHELALLIADDHASDERFILAYIWLLRALWAGDDDLDEDMERIANQLSPEQRHRAEEQAKSPQLNEGPASGSAL